MIINESHKHHLDVLLYNDAMSMEMQGCNHNASDRAAMYDTWIDDLKAPDFEARARAARDLCDNYIYNSRLGKYSQETSERFLASFDGASLS